MKFHYLLSLTRSLGKYSKPTAVTKIKLNTFNANGTLNLKANVHVINNKKP